MALEDRGAQHDKIIVDKYHDPAADYEMTSRDYVLRPSADGDSGPITITLPSVAEAKGRFYSILARDADGTNDITVQDQDDSEYWAGDVTMDGAGDRVLLYSDGLCWHTVTSVLTAADTTAAPTTAAP